MRSNGEGFRTAVDDLAEEVIPGCPFSIIVGATILKGRLLCSVLSESVRERSPSVAYVEQLARP